MQKAELESSPTNLFDEETQSQFIEWGQRRNKDSWWLGRKTFAYIEADNSLPKEHQIGTMKVYSGIAQLTGVSARTVRYYRDVAKFYPDEIQEAFDVLPFSHFATAMQYPEPVKLLEKAIAYMEDRGGRPPTVEWLESQAGTAPIQDEEENAEQSEGIARADYKVLAGIINALKKLLTVWPGDSSHIDIAIEELQNAIKVLLPE
jgi:hypothetical protein